MKNLLISVLLILNFVNNAQASDRERTVCGFIQEPLLFWLWSSAAPNPDEKRVGNSDFILATDFNTSDDKTLKGYKYVSNDGIRKSRPNGYILMALGNAMIADQIITSLRDFSMSGYDVYIYDYRGYGNSEGNRRINAIIEDYKEIIGYLNSKYKKHLLYGISLGGAVIMNAIGSGVEYDAAVIDSSPSRISDYGCPENIYPVNNLPIDAKKILVITGKQDQVLSPDMTSLLRVEAQKRGSKVIDGDEFSHPFMDQERAVHRKRMKIVLDHLMQVSDNEVKENE